MFNSNITEDTIVSQINNNKLNDDTMIFLTLKIKERKQNRSARFACIIDPCASFYVEIVFITQNRVHGESES